MSFTWLFRAPKVRAPKTRRGRRPRGWFRPEVENLETRCLLSAAVLGSNVLVNNPAEDLGANNVQSTTAVAVAGPNLVVAYTDNGSLLGSSNQLTGYAVSTDGGASFTDKGTLPASSAGDNGDPALAYGQGNLWLATPAFSGAGIELFQSTDNGNTFTIPVNAATGFASTDVLTQPRVVVDNFIGTGNGNIYVTYGDLVKGKTPNGIYFSMSANGGVTWGSPTQLAVGNAFGSQVLVGPDHSIYVLWLDQNSPTTQIMFSKSTNLGVTFSAPAPVVSLTNNAPKGDLGLGGGFATNSFPQAAVNPMTGDLYVAYNDAGTSPDKADIYFTQSADKGGTWSAAAKVNDDKGSNDQWDPAIAVTPDGKRVGIFWYDRRSDSTNTAIERWGTVGTITGGVASFATANFVVQDNGKSFPVMLPTSPSLPSNYMGDFDGVAPSTDGNYFYAAWGDNRDGAVQGPNVRLAKVSSARPPVAVADNYHIDATASALSVNAANGVLANDTDVDGDTLTVDLASVVQPTYGTVTMAQDGSFTFTPSPTFLTTGMGTTSFTYKAKDNDGDSSSAATVTITTGNVPPLARNDAYVVAPNSTLKLTDPTLGLLANDTDFDGKSIVVDKATVTQPANGTLTVNADGTFSYTPNTDFKGVDTFTYKAKEVGGSASDSNPATVTLTVALSSNSWAPFGPGPVTASGQGSQQVAGDGRVTGIAGDPTKAKTFYISAAGGGVWKTTDGGLSWVPLTDNQATLSMGAIAVAPSNAQIIYAGTGEANNTADSQYGLGVLKSTDGGATWSLLTGNAGKNEFNRRTISRIVVDPTDPNRVYVAVSDNGTNGLFGNTGIWRSTDGGTTWTNTTLGIDPTASYPFSDLVINPNTSGSTAVLYAAVGNPYGALINGVYKSTNGGDTWSVAGNFPTGSTNNSATGRIALAISPSTPSTLYAAVTGSGQNNSTAGALLEMLVSTDGGAHWSVLGTTPDYMSISQLHDGVYDTALAVDPSSPSIVYAGGLNLYKSTTGGTSWSAVSGYPLGNGIHALSFDASGNLLVGDTSGVWSLTSKGVLTNVTGNLQIAQFNGVAVDPTQSPLAYGGTQDNGTVKSIGALEWFPIASGSAGVNMSGGHVLVDPNTTSIIYHTFTGLSLQRSTDAGKTWANIIKGITVTSTDPAPDAIIPYAIDPGNSAHLLLGTNSLWESFDSGATWKAIGGPGFAGWSGNAPIDNVAISTFQPTGNPPVTTIYVTTGGDGASSSTNNHVFTTFYNPQTYVPGTTVLTWQKIDVVAQETINGQIVNQVFNDHFGQMVIDPTNPEVVYAVRDRFTGAQYGHVFRTQDGGNNWQDISSTLPDMPFHTVALDSVNHVLLIGADSGVYSSNNFDKTSVTWLPFGAQLPNAVVAQLQVLPGANLVVAGTHGRGVFEIQERQPPVAVADNYQMLLNTTLVSSATSGIPGLLANDTDPVGDPFTLSLVRLPLNGSLQITDPNSPKGYFTYKPDKDFRGVDTFTYKDFDPLLGSFGNTATVTITVTGTPPTAISPAAYTTTINTALVVPKATGLLASGNYLEPTPVDALTPVVQTAPAHGVVTTLNADGSFTYTPTTGFVGTDSFTYVLQDALDGSSNTATVTIHVKPVANADTYQTQVNSTLTVAAANGVLANDLFHTGDTLTLTPTTGPSLHGSLTLNNDGSFTYTPTSGFSGTATFQYTLADNGQTSSAATVSIGVSPLAAVADSYGPITLATNLVATLNVTTKAQGLLANDLDDVAGTPTLQVDTASVTQPAHGTVVINDATKGTFTYTSNSGFRGVDTFTYKAKDSVHGDSLPATVSITVQGPSPTATADPSVSNAAFYRVPTNGTLNVDATHGVLANDVKLSDDTLTAVLNAGPSNGTLTGGLASDGSFTYVPNTAYYGTDTFTYHAHGAKDGDSNIATVTITVVPQPPTAAAHSYTTTINFHYSGTGLLTGATDPQNQTPFTAVPGTSGTSQGGSVTVNANGTFLYTPKVSFEGTDTFTYKVKDALLLTSPSATVTLTVNPVAAADPGYQTSVNTKLVVNAAGGVLANDTFRAGDVAVLGTGPANGTLVGGLGADGSFTYVPNTGFSGADTFTYVVQDAAAPGGPVQSAAATVTITVNPLFKGAGVTLHAFADPFARKPPFSGVIGNFTSATAGVTAANFSVLSINWGDGTALDTTSGKIVMNSAGAFSVLGTHRYTKTGQFTVTMVVKDSLGNTLTLQATAVVGYALF